MVDSLKLFSGTEDHFKGVTVNSIDEEGGEIEEIETKLKNSLENWSSCERKGIWFNVYLQHTNWIPILVKYGFKFHHAFPEYVTMLKWLPENEANNIPSYAHHMIGAGGVVVNSKKELLVVQEKYSRDHYWKLPGGYVDPKEDLHEAAIREVLEETGIPTTFKSLICIRQVHEFNFGCSDLYFVTELIPTKEEITMCEKELSKCEWMKIDDFLTHSRVSKVNKFIVQKYVDAKECGISLGLNKLAFEKKNDYNIYNFQTKH